MPILEHLGELRRRLLIIVVALLIGVLLTYWKSLDIIEFLIAPVKPFMGGQSPTILNFLGAFSIRFKVSLYGSIILMSPIIFWQIFGFFLPALKPKERKWVIPTVIAAVILFIIGNIFCYMIIIPTAYEWMIAQAGDVLALVPNAEVLISSLTLFLAGFGVSFELPLVIFYLVTFNIVKYQTLRKNWRIIYLVLMIVSAIATPDASPVTMLIMFAALTVLYELSLILSYIASGKRRRAKEQADLYDDDDEDDEEDGGSWWE